MTSWREAAALWAAADPDPATRAEVEKWLREEDESALGAGFEAPLAFGTAGLRGPVGAGPSRMNRALICRVTWALGQRLLNAALGQRPVVLGFDGRAVSVDFALVASEILSGMGLPVVAFDEPVPTPLVAFAVRLFGAGAGIAVTPSHNPRGDAGYKVFDDQGIQIVAPWDEEIARWMASCSGASSLRRDRVNVKRLGLEEVLGPYEGWLAELDRLVPDGAPESTRVTSIAYTPLHGVGYSFAKRSVGRFVELLPVQEQVAIDGTFPTTPFPNPEEKGSLDLLITKMRNEGLDLGAANDPDADRLCVVAPRPNRGELAPLSGDQLGLLFADALLSDPPVSSPLVVSSVVSSPALADLARARGARHVSTLTGFKWICRAGAQDPAFIFAYEEALGYCFAMPGRSRVLDKDGLAGLRLLARIVRSGQERMTPGEILAGRRVELARRIGLWVSASRSIRVAGTDPMGALAVVMARLRASPPSELGGERVLRVLDFRQGANERPDYLGEQDLLIFEFGERSRICVRPSGTEPKLKLYVHHVGKLTPEDEFVVREDELLADAQRYSTALADQLF